MNARAFLPTALRFGTALALRLASLDRALPGGTRTVDDLSDAALRDIGILDGRGGRPRDGMRD